VVGHADLVHKLEDIDAMFVQSAVAFDCIDDRVVLRSVSPSTIFFSDRPQRIAGHIGTDEFVELWSEGNDSFEQDPPNAVLAFIETGKKAPNDVVITITAPHLEGHDLSYAMSVLEGRLPRHATGCTLFIDPFGRPLSPVSIAGMRRRSNRRIRRRVALAPSTRLRW
jgi:hypothetical protein